MTDGGLARAWAALALEAARLRQQSRELLEQYKQLKEKTQ